jgi:hypothetical protein
MTVLKALMSAFEFSPAQQRWVLDTTKEKMLSVRHTDLIPDVDEALGIVKEGQAVQRRWELQKGAQPGGRDVVAVAGEIDAIVGGIDGTLGANGRRRLGNRGRQALVLRRALLPMGWPHFVATSHVEKVTRTEELIAALRDPANVEAVRAFGLAGVADELEPLLVRFMHMVVPVMPLTWSEVVAATRLGHEAMLRVICRIAGHFDVRDPAARAERDALLLPYLDMKARVHRTHVERRNRKARKEARAEKKAAARAEKDGKGAAGATPATKGAPGAKVASDAGAAGGKVAPDAEIEEEDDDLVDDEPLDEDEELDDEPDDQSDQDELEDVPEDDEPELDDDELDDDLPATGAAGEA